MADQHVWEVRYTIPYRYGTAPTTRVGRANREAMVIAATAQRAIGMLADAEDALEDGEVEIIQVIRRNRFMRLLIDHPEGTRSA